MNTIGKSLRLTLFGASHDSFVGCSIDGLPAGYAVSVEDIENDLALRRPAAGIGTARHEDDIPAVSGLQNGCTTGAPVVITFANSDVRSEDYAAAEHIPRPGHADYPAFCKYGPAFDVRGGSFFFRKNDRTACCCRRASPRSACGERNPCRFVCHKNRCCGGYGFVYA